MRLSCIRETRAAEFLERTKDDPSRCLRATVKLAREAIASQQSAPARESEQLQVVVQHIDSMFDSARH
jgi:hypothetical protein